jgi:plasmid stabilization system protein ParE
MAKVNWTAEAERWLRDIHDYIAADSPEAASRVVEGIYSRVDCWSGSRSSDIGT